MLILKDRRGEWKLRVLRKRHAPREFSLTLLETGSVKNGDRLWLLGFILKPCTQAPMDFPQ